MNHYVRRSPQNDPKTARQDIFWNFQNLQKKTRKKHHPKNYPPKNRILDAMPPCWSFRSSQVVGGFKFQPLWKMCSSNWIISPTQISGWTYIFELPPPSYHGNPSPGVDPGPPEQSKAKTAFFTAATCTSFWDVAGFHGPKKPTRSWKI